MDGPEITVRDARPGDAEVIARFNEAMARETESLTLDPKTIRSGVRAVLADPSKGRYLVADRAGEVAGALLVTYEWSDWRNACYIWLQSVYVHPAHRRRGVFRRLFHHVEKLGSAPGFSGLRLYMDAHNAAARETYQSLGLVHRNYLVFEGRDPLREAGEGR
jgi:GNAT superfamily N-acetyltransferase